MQVCSLLVGPKAGRHTVTVDYAQLRNTLLNELQAQFPSVDLLRVYWYDGPGPNGSKTQSHTHIEDLDDFKLRLGMRNGVGQQKAVDGLIIADMISLTQSKAITDALLVSGDADIAPGVVAAQALGLRVHLLSIGALAATSPYLAAEVDRKTAWSTADVSPFAQPSGITTTVQPHPPVAAATSPTVQNPLSPATQLPAGIDYPTVAQVAHTAIGSGPLAVAMNALTPSTIQLPADIDKALLASAKSQIGRLLAEQEKRSLRKAFKALL